MQLKLLAKFLVFCSLSVAIAQDKVKVEGTVVEQDSNIPLEYATITFKTKPTNKVVTGGITDAKGKFSVDVPIGTYDISVEYISYKTKTYADKLITKGINLGTVSLALDIESLGEVTIIAERTTVEIKLDKKIYNVGQDLTVRGGTVSDVLDNIPSVSVDVEGVVALRGNNDVRILINGKPSGLVGLNSTEALRQLPADAIERVEVITSPSGRYDAEGTAGILNIILRRSKLQGFNGAVTVNAGYPEQAGISGNVNYRTGDVNFFNTTSYNYRSAPGSAFTNTNYLSTNNRLEENRDFERIRKGLNTGIGLEWYINETASLTAALQYRDSNNESETTNIIQEFDADGSLTNTTKRFDPEFEKDITRQYNLNFDKQFGDSVEHKLTGSFQIESSGELETSLIVQDEVPSEDVRTDEQQDRYFLQADYVIPLNVNSLLEMGYQGRFLNLDTDYAVAFNDGSGDFILNEDLSNNLIYKEYVNAAYVQFGSQIKEKFSYLLGLRMEDSRITIDQVTSRDFDKKNYTDFFPTVNLSYEFTEDQNLTLGYNRRIRRPRSRYINPFPSRSSATNLFQGNPDLNPSYSNTIDLGYYEKFGKFSLNSSVYYQHATDVFVFITEETGETVIVGGTEVPVIRRTPINLATNDRYGFEFTATLRPNKKWNINGNFNIFQSITKGFYEGTDFGAENLSWFARLNNKYTLPGSIDWQTRLNFRGPSENAQNKSSGIFSMDLAFSKDFFNNRGSLAFNISDVFNSRKRMTETVTPSFTSESEYQRRVRSFNLAFTYRFNQQKKRERSGSGNGNGGDDFDFEG